MRSSSGLRPAPPYSTGPPSPCGGEPLVLLAVVPAAHQPHPLGALAPAELLGSGRAALGVRFEEGRRLVEEGAPLLVGHLGCRTVHGHVRSPLPRRSVSSKGPVGRTTAQSVPIPPSVRD